MLTLRNCVLDCLLCWQIILLKQVLEFSHVFAIIMNLHFDILSESVANWKILGVLENLFHPSGQGQFPSFNVFYPQRSKTFY